MIHARNIYMVVARGRGANGGDTRHRYRNYSKHTAALFELNAQHKNGRTAATTQGIVSTQNTHVNAHTQYQRNDFLASDTLAAGPQREYMRGRHGAHGLS